MTATDIFNRWSARLIDALAARGIGHTEGARQLLVTAMLAQVEEGPTRDLAQVEKWLAQFPIDGIATLFATKYNGRKLNFNRCIRLLADLHELWLDARAMAIAPPAIPEPELAGRGHV
jgi:hypothetical protein